MPLARRIDVHLHIVPPFYQDIVREAGLGPARRAGYPPYSPELALEVMDANEIEAGLTSVAQPGVQFAEAPQAKTLARRLNEHASELMARWPNRFGAFATVPMRDIKDAVAEVEYSLDVLKHHGVSLFASYSEKFLGDLAFDPVMDALNQRRAVVFIHPTLHPSSRALTLPWPAFIMEYLFDTTRAAVNLLMGGTIDRYPDIQFILPHAGGTLPYFAWRLASTPMIDPTMPQWSREQFAAKLRHFWYDVAISSGPTTMGALKTVADPRKIVFGSDWPFVQAPLVADAIKLHTSPGLHSDAERAAIDRRNALTLFPQFG
ncbi:MAG: amidohydrolase family protein [Rhizobiales bacterium]|nr:amidohydrolase family protein [Hyphomicrobiales bacterium]